MSNYTFRKAVRTNTSTLISLSGPSGSGKTYSAIRLARGLVGEHGKMVLIDTEAGRALHYADQFNFDHLDLHPPFSPENYAKAIVAAEEAGYAAIIVDSMSHEWAGNGGCQDMHDEAHEKLGNTDATNILAWRDPKLDHKRMVSRFLQSRSQLLFCLRAEEKIKFTKDEKGKTQIVPQGWMPICEKNFQYEMTVSFMLHDENPGYGKPIKLQEQHKAFFDLTKPLDEQAGAKLAQWANGGITARHVVSKMETSVDPAQEAYERSVWALQAGRTEIRQGDGLELGTHEVRTSSQSVTGSASQDAPAPISNLSLDAEIEQQDFEKEYRARFEKAFGTAANPIYKELLADARVTPHTRNQLYGDYTRALKTQQVKT